MTAVTVKILRLPHGEGLPLPAARSAGAAGHDLAAAIPADHPLVIAPGARALVPTGFAIALPPGFEGQVRPRSGLAVEYGVTVLNAPGTVDADYRGEVEGTPHQPRAPRRSRSPAACASRNWFVAAVAAAAFAEADALPPTERGSGGFGSTGISE